MGITEVTVPKQYVIVQNTEPTAQFQGQIWYKPDTANTYIYQADEWKLITIDPSGEFSFIENEIATHELNIIELRAVTETTPIDSDTLLSDTFSTSAGLKESVNTDNTTAGFNINQYERINVYSELSKSLINYYKMDEAEGNAIDTHGNFDLIENGTVGTTTGIIEDARGTFSANNYFKSSTGIINNLNGRTNLTITGWFKRPATLVNDFETLFVLDNAQSEANIVSLDLYFTKSTNNLQARIRSNNTDYVSGNITYTGTDWAFFCVTFNNGVVTFKVNTTTSTESTQAVAGTSANAYFKLSGNTSNQYSFSGHLDEIAIFNKVLSNDEIAEVYNSGNGESYTNLTNELIETKLIETNLPTISGEVSHTQLIINGQIETDASITYKLNNGTTDSAEVNLNTKNAYTLIGNPTKLKIYLNPKETSATNGNPSIKTYCLKIWKSGGE